MADHMVHERHHDPTPGLVPVPHGPPTGDEFERFPTHEPANEEEERQIFSYLTHPDDNYTPEGVYWADLPLSKRISFVNKVQNAEAAKEWKATWALFKKDPLAPMGWYFRNAVLPGAGLGLEGYVLFSIGNLTPLFQALWPACFSKYTECSENWVASITYLEVIGIMVGQVAVGLIGDWIGRRWGLIQDAAIMFVGLLMLTASWGLTLQGFVICYAWSLFFYSFGVGGEYPITATSSMENAVGAGKLSTRDDRLHRGRKVVSAFLMQGWGQFFNQVILILLLLIFHHGDGDPSYGASTVQWTFRVSFAIPAVGTLWLVYYRTYKMPHASRQLAIAKKRNNVTGYDVQSLKLCCYHFGGRLLATTGGWFCNDVFFYGNKLFQSQFIKVISPENSSSVMVGWVWNLLNVIVSLFGYYLASFLIDNKLYGRKWMQQVGFAMCFIMFVVPAFNYYYYSHASGIHSFQAMYFLSSFFNQFGPNCVTFLVAGEVFPTPVRATAHGFSAMLGKAGALLASVLYNYIDTQTKFYVVPWFGLAGMLITLLWLPDTTGLDLKEQERRWEYLRTGRGHEYHGIAVHPQHLSLWERLMGVGKTYDPELDRKQKIEDMRVEWSEKQRARQEAEMRGEDAAEAVGDDEFNAEVHEYFQRTTSREQMYGNGNVPEANGNGVGEKERVVNEKGTETPES